MPGNKHNKDKKLHNSEGEETSLADLLVETGVDDRAIAEDYIAESEARWARIAPPDKEELPEDSEFEYRIGIANLQQEIAKKAIRREPIALTPHPVTLIPAPKPSSMGTQNGAAALYSNDSSKSANTTELNFAREDLDEYVAYRSEGLAPKSKDWINRASKLLWERAGGEVSRVSITSLRDAVLDKYKSRDSHSKVLSFASALLKHLAVTRAEPRYQTFVPYLEMPRAVKQRKSVTTRIVTIDDVTNVHRYIKKAERRGEIDAERSAQYSAFVMFMAYTGQRSEATIAKLRVGQFREALAADKPVLLVEASQDKIRMEHYVPLHPRIVEAVESLLEGRDDNELMFTHGSLLNWVKREKIPMSGFKGHFALGDLRKFAEQHGDVIG